MFTALLWGGRKCDLFAKKSVFKLVNANELSIHIRARRIAAEPLKSTSPARLVLGAGVIRRTSRTPFRPPMEWPSFGQSGSTLSG